MCPNRKIAGFLDTPEATRQHDATFKVLKGKRKVLKRKEKKKNYQLKILFPERVSFKNEGEINTFSDKQKKRICCYQTLLCKNITYSG